MFACTNLHLRVRTCSACVPALRVVTYGCESNSEDSIESDDDEMSEEVAMGEDGAADEYMSDF